MTDYIATRWYRAPEVILSWRKYTAAIDVWSVGCILAELIIRKPLLPATSEEEQLNMITKLLGNPSAKLVNQIENEKNKEFVLQLPKRDGKNFDELFKGANANAIDLLKKMLTYDPADRITIKEALQHPYLKQLHFPDDEPETEPVSAFDFDFENLHMDLNLFNFFGIDFTWTFFVQLLILITLFLIYMAVLEIKDHTRDMFDRENNTTDKNKYKK